MGETSSLCWICPVTSLMFSMWAGDTEVALCCCRAAPLRSLCSTGGQALSFAVGENQAKRRPQDMASGHWCCRMAEASCFEQLCNASRYFSMPGLRQSLILNTKHSAPNGPEVLPNPLQTFLLRNGIEHLLVSSHHISCLGTTPAWGAQGAHTAAPQEN